MDIDSSDLRCLYTQEAGARFRAVNQGLLLAQKCSEWHAKKPKGEIDRVEWRGGIIPRKPREVVYVLGRSRGGCFQSCEE